jgi:hypothetical protein
VNGVHVAACLRTSISLPYHPDSCSLCLEWRGRGGGGGQDRQPTARPRSVASQLLAWDGSERCAAVGAPLVVSSLSSGEWGWFARDVFNQGCKIQR